MDGVHFVLGQSQARLVGSVERDVADLRAGGDEKKRYFLNRPAGEKPRDGWRALFVLPGGPGSADFQPFVSNIARNAVSPDYVVVQLVAPVWDAEEAKHKVWPSDKVRVRGMKFDTLDFYLAVRADVEKAYPLDKRYVFTLTWSSSGSNGYLFSLTPKAAVTGTFVAMSVFQPAWLPPISRARGHPYFIYHSPEDTIPFAQAEAAQDTLQKAGAKVQLQSYAGGHGWHGDPMADIKKGVRWLEEQVSTARTTR
jgi:hypothetical protein